ncbi:MAG: flavodoxin domain-containing protein [Actinomycetota bacterium]
MDRKVLVAYGTKHGAPAELAERIGAALREAGLLVDVHKAGEVKDVPGYGAVVLGSGVYYGRWVRSAARFLKK